MKLYKTFFKLLFIRNRLNYLLVVFTIIVTYIIISITMVYVDNAILLDKVSTFSYNHYFYISLRTLFVIAGVTLIISQYYNIMKFGMRDYYILIGLGATKGNITLLIFIQMIFLMIVSIPIGLFGGYFITGRLLQLLEGFSLNKSMLDSFSSFDTFYFLAGATLLCIILLGIFIARGIRKMPLSFIFADNFKSYKEGYKDGNL